MTPTPDVFTTPGMTRAHQLLADMSAWANDTAAERAEIARQIEELAEVAAQARQAVLAADQACVIENAIICFAGINAAIDHDTGDVQIVRPEVTFYLDDVALVAFVFGGFAGKDVMAAPVEEPV